MIMAKVATGNYRVGDKHVTRANLGERVHSTVNSTSNPSIFLSCTMMLLPIQSMSSSSRNWIKAWPVLLLHIKVCLQVSQLVIPDLVQIMLAAPMLATTHLPHLIEPLLPI